MYTTNLQRNKRSAGELEMRKYTYFENKPSLSHQPQLNNNNKKKTWQYKLLVIKNKQVMNSFACAEARFDGFTLLAVRLLA